MAVATEESSVALPIPVSVIRSDLIPMKLELFYAYYALEMVVPSYPVISSINAVGAGLK